MVMSIVNSVFRPDKCCLIDDRNESYCVYFMDIVFAVVILLLLIPQVFVVSVLVEMYMHYCLETIHIPIMVSQCTESCFHIVQGVSLIMQNRELVQAIHWLIVDILLPQK